MNYYMAILTIVVCLSILMIIFSAIKRIRIEDNFYDMDYDKYESSCNMCNFGIATGILFVISFTICIFLHYDWDKTLEVHFKDGTVISSDDEYSINIDSVNTENDSIKVQHQLMDKTNTYYKASDIDYWTEEDGFIYLDTIRHDGMEDIEKIHVAKGYE